MSSFDCKNWKKQKIGKYPVWINAYITSLFTHCFLLIAEKKGIVWRYSFKGKFVKNQKIFWFFKIHYRFWYKYHILPKSEVSDFHIYRDSIFTKLPDLKTLWENNEILNNYVYNIISVYICISSMFSLREIHIQLLFYVGCGSTSTFVQLWLNHSNCWRTFYKPAE